MNKIFKAFGVAAVAVFLAAIPASAAENRRIAESPQKFVINGEPALMDALNINDYNYVKAAELAKLLDIDVTYDSKTNTVTLDKSKAYTGVRLTSNPGAYDFKIEGSGTDWFCGFNNPYFDINGDKVLTGVSLEFTKGLENGQTTFILTDYGGSVDAFEGLTLYSDKVEFRIFQYVTIGGDWWIDLRDGALVIMGETDLRPDSPALRETLAKAFRFYLNGEMIKGCLKMWGGNGHMDYTVHFDTPINLADAATIRVEIGYK